MVSSSVESSPSPSSTRRSSGVSRKLSLHNPRTQDVFQSIVNGRKSWKTLRGGEVVWPPELEAALIEGLENYQPDDSRETRLLGRFPMRNRFISDWIFEKTGKRRTAKQVGSRLQQLRDTCGGKRLLNLLSPHRRPYRAPSLSPEFQQRDSHLTYGPPPLQYESESGSDSSTSTPPTPTEAHATLQSLLYRGVEPRIEELPDTIVYIDLLRSDINDEESQRQWTSGDDEESAWTERGYKVIHPSQQPRLISEIDPTITLLSHAATSAKSYFTVHTDDGIVYSESTVLQSVSTSTAGNNDLLYTTSLVPGYWDIIRRSSDATQFVIIQRVVLDGASSSVACPTIFSAMYRFKYATAEEVFSSPSVSSIDVPSQRNDFSAFDSLLPLDTDGFSDLMAYQKPQQYFEMHSYVATEWNNMSSDNSVYTNPADCSRPLQIMMNDQQVLPSNSSFHMPDIYSLGS